MRKYVPKKENIKKLEIYLKKIEQDGKFKWMGRRVSK